MHRSALLLLTLLLDPALAAQDEVPAVRYLAREDRIEVKLRDDSGATLDRDGRLCSTVGVDLGAVARIFAEAELAERGSSLPLEVLDAWHRHADRVLPAGAVRPGHLGRWFILTARDPGQARRLIEALRAEPAVTYADLEPIPLPASPPLAEGTEDIPPPTPDFTHLQTYRGAAPTGLGFDAVRWVLGARGELARVLHVEVDWVWDHEDLALTPAHFVGVPTSTATDGANHGTAIVGVLYARRNGYGLTGVVDATDLRLVSVDQYGSLLNSITTAVVHARPGDVVTLIGGYNLQLAKPNDIIPYEYFQINFDAFLTATALGVIVVESAANGDNDLDDPRFQRRFDLSVRDSGAIMVGATDGSDLRRAPYSNYGSRIDANAWGYGVATLGYGTLFSPTPGRRQQYTERSAGTSSASALITGVIASIASAVRQQQGRTVTPAEVRRLLRTHGTASAGDIGLRPDLAAIFAALGLVDGLELDRAEVGLGQNLNATLRGATGSSAVIWLSFATGSVDLGLGRALHLDPGGLVPLGAVVLRDGAAAWPTTIPNDPGLADLDLFLQGLVVAPAGAGLRLTNSASFWVH
jgi:subtilisin family serine protease